MAREVFQAIKAYRTVLSLNQSLVLAHYNLGNTYFQKGIYEDARMEWQKTLEIDPKFTLAIEKIESLKKKDIK